MAGLLLPKSLPEGVFVNGDGRHDGSESSKVGYIAVASGIGVSSAVINVFVARPIPNLPWVESESQPEFWRSCSGLAGH